MPQEDTANVATVQEPEVLRSLLPPGAKLLRFIFSCDVRVLERHGVTRLQWKAFREQVIEDIRCRETQQPYHEAWRQLFYHFWYRCQGTFQNEQQLKRMFNEALAVSIDGVDDDELVRCDHCGQLEWENQLTEVNSIDVCRSCAEDARECPGCNELRLELEYRVEDEYVCEDCFTSGGVVTCACGCDRLLWRENAEWDENTGEYYNPYHKPEPEPICSCDNWQLRFSVPALGLEAGVLVNDTLASIEMGGGEIDEVAWTAIVNYVFRTSGRIMSLPASLWEAVGDKWQSKEGNFPKRLVNTLYRDHGIKLSDQMLAEIGNIARQNAANSKRFNVDVSRRYDEGRERFANAGSCWWSEYKQSLEWFKHNGGFGLRMWADNSEGPSDRHSMPAGRAWVLPFQKPVLDGRNLQLRPELDPMKAHAFGVFNVYLHIGGPQLTFARLLAQMTGKTYGRFLVGNMADGVYMNDSDAMVLVTDAETLALRYTDPYGNKQQPTLDIQLGNCW